MGSANGLQAHEHVSPIPAAAARSGWTRTRTAVETVYAARRQA